MLLPQKMVTPLFCDGVRTDDGRSQQGTVCHEWDRCVELVFARNWFCKLMVHCRQRQSGQVEQNS